MEYDPKSSLMTMANNIAHKHRLTDIKKNAHDLDDVLTFRVNSALKKSLVGFVRRISLLQVLNLSAICSKLLSKVLYNFNRPIDEFTPHLLS